MIVARNGLRLVRGSEAFELHKIPLLEVRGKAESGLDTQSFAFHGRFCIDSSAAFGCARICKLTGCLHVWGHEMNNFCLCFVNVGNNFRNLFGSSLFEYCPRVSEATTVQILKVWEGSVYFLYILLMLSVPRPFINVFEQPLCSTSFGPCKHILKKVQKSFRAERLGKLYNNLEISHSRGDLVGWPYPESDGLRGQDMYSRWRCSPH